MSDAHGNAFVRIVFVALASAVAAQQAIAADVPCGVGTQVQGEFGGGEVGTIAEIGSVAPHVGWYRITFRWSPDGEWFHPGTWKIEPSASDDRCIVPTAGSSTAGSPTKGSGAAPVTAAGVDPSVLVGVVSSDRCRSGAAVVDRQQRSGSVLGEANGMCKVRLADGEVRSYLAWMLAASGAAAGGATDLAPGSYTCSADGAGIFRVEIRDGGNYVNSSGGRGRYAFDAATSMIKFSSGSLSGYHSKLLGSGSFGLSEDSTTMFYTVCNLQN